MQTAGVKTSLDDPPRPASQRLQFLDALRGIGAVAVVIQHVGDAYVGFSYTFSRTWFNFGKFGVTVFFLVSGFVIPYAFEKDDHVGKFWIKRFFRLYPLYWLSLAATIVAARAYPDGFIGPHLIRNEITNITMLQGFLGIPNASDPYWTLFIEMAFYFAFTAFFLTNIHKKTLALTWVAMACFALTSIVYPLISNSHGPFTISFCFLTMLVGSTFYRRFKREVSAGALAALLLAILLSGSLGIYVNYFKISAPEHVAARAVFGPLVCGFLVFGAAMAWRIDKFPRALLWLGRISYSLYLLHAVILNVIPSFPNKVIDIFAVICLSVVVSALTYQYFERPFISIGRRVALRYSR